MKTKTLAITTTLIVAACAATGLAHRLQDPQRIDLKITGGHLTDPRDMGRPVVLVAGALGVPAPVFREAFTHVIPARDGRPEPEQVHQNKDALLYALSRYGITNDRLDEVSDRYRYRPEDGPIWNHANASGYVTIENGVVSRMVITDPGNGYTSTPKISIPGMESAKFRVTLHYGAKFSDNGSIANVVVK